MAEPGKAYKKYSRHPVSKKRSQEQKWPHSTVSESTDVYGSEEQVEPEPPFNLPRTRSKQSIGRDKSPRIGSLLAARQHSQYMRPKGSSPSMNSSKSSMFQRFPVQETEIDDGEVNNDLFINWSEFRSVDDIRSLGNKIFKEKIEYLDKYPGVFHSNLKGKLAFVPDEVRREVYLQKTTKDTYLTNFHQLYNPSEKPQRATRGSKTEKSFDSRVRIPIVKQGLGVVLFIDISGFTALGKHYKTQHPENPKRAADLLSSDIISVLNDLTDICYHHGGVVAKFAGDAILCIWKLDLEQVVKRLEQRMKKDPMSSPKQLKSQVIYEECEAKLVLAKCAAYEMMLAAQSCSVSSSNPFTCITLHGGIGIGNLVHIFLGSSKRDNSQRRTASTKRTAPKNYDGLKWYLVNGYGVDMATKLLESSPSGEVKYPVNYRRWLDHYIEHLFFHDFSSKLNAPPIKEGEVSDPLQDPKLRNLSLYHETFDSSNLAVISLETKTVEKWDKPISMGSITEQELINRILVEEDVDDYIPTLLKAKLEGNAVDGNELTSGIAVMFVRLDNALLKAKYFLHLDIETNGGGSRLCENFKDSLEYLSQTFIALSNSIKRVGGEVRDLIFDDKGCVFICVFSAHKHVSNSAYRAVRASRDIVQAHQRARIGISCGSCFVGLCGNRQRSDFIVMGDDVNFAARMMAKAENGEILVSPVVFESLHEAFHFSSTTILIKKKQQSCYKVVGSSESPIKPTPRGELLCDINSLTNDYKRTAKIILKQTRAFLQNPQQLKRNLGQLCGPFHREVGRKDVIDRIRLSLESGNPCFIHGGMGSGKSTIINMLDHSLKKDPIKAGKKYRVFVASCAGWESQDPYSVLRKLFSKLFDVKALQHSFDLRNKASRGKDWGDTSFLKQTTQFGDLASGSALPVPLLEKLLRLNIPVDFGSWKYMLPNINSFYTGNNQASRMRQITAKAHLDSLQTLLSRAPTEEQRAACSKLAKALVQNLPTLCFDDEACNRAEKALGLKKQKSNRRPMIVKNCSVVFIKRTVNTNETGVDEVVATAETPDSREEASKIVNESDASSPDTEFVLVLEDFEQVDSFSLDALEEILESNLPKNVRLVFTMNRVQKMAPKSSDSSRHNRFLQRLCHFRECLERSTHRDVDDFIVESLTEQESCVLLKKYVFNLLLTHVESGPKSTRIKHDFFTHCVLRFKTIKYESELFYDQCFRYFFSNLDSFDITKSLQDIYSFSHGNVGRMVSLARDFTLRYLLKHGSEFSAIQKVPKSDRFLKVLPDNVVGEVRNKLDMLPGICLWVTKILSVIGFSFLPKAAFRICQAQYDKTVSKTARTRSKVAHYNISKSSYHRRQPRHDVGGDFNLLFSLALSTLIRYEIIVSAAHSDFSYEDGFKDRKKSSMQPSRLSSTDSMRWKKGSRDSSLLAKSAGKRRNSSRVSTTFEIGNIRVSSMFFTDKDEAFQFSSPVEFMVIRGMIPSQRKKALKATISRHRIN